MSKHSQLTIDFPVRKSLRSAAGKPGSPALDAKLTRLRLTTPSPATTPQKPQPQTRIRSAKKLFQSSDQENAAVSPTKQRKVCDEDCASQRQPDPVHLFEEAKRALNPSFLTDVKFREKEYAKAKSFLETCLSTQKPGSIYISGPPGTGKTLSMNHIVQSLGKEYTFRSVMINCMGCRTPDSVYEKILTEAGLQTPRKRKECLDVVTDKIVTPSKGKKRPMTIIVFDEIDELESKNQDVLYTLFEWPLFEESKVIVVGISNTLDFTNRHLKRLPSLKVKAIETVSFQPYTKDQVKHILKSRLPLLPDGSPLVEDAALELCARKVSSLCGDIRKALDVIRRAIELSQADSVSRSSGGLRATSDDGLNCSPRKQGTDVASKDARGGVVGIRHVNRVLSDVYASKALEVASGSQCLPGQQQLTLCALLLLSKFSSKKETTLSRAHRVFVKICNKKNAGSSAETVSDFLSMCHLLEAKGFVAVRTGKETSLSKISLNVDEAEVEQVMADKSLLRSILCDSGLIK